MEDHLPGILKPFMCKVRGRHYWRNTTK